MALSGDHLHQILLDSTYRNRKKFPHPSEFEITVRPDTLIASDPVALGYIILSDIVVAYDNTTSPERVELTAGISDYINKYIGSYIEIVDSVTYDIKGTAKIVGVTTGPPYTFVYLSTPMANIVANDLIFIRQLQISPVIRFNPSAPVLAGDTSFQFSGGSKRADFYKGMYLRNVSTLGIDYKITSYDVTTSPPTITFTPSVELGGFGATDFIEIYNVIDNENGLNTIGSVANRSAPVNHEVSLEWLRIPRHPIFVNNTLDTPPSLALTVNNFSYLIVEFHNKSYGTNSAIQSNNKNVRNGHFIVPVEDMSTGVGKFYTLSSTTKVVLQHNPNDIIKFSVRFPNGQLIQFDPDDEPSDTLLVPNPDLQISAMFSIKRCLH